MHTLRSTTTRRTATPAVALLACLTAAVLAPAPARALSDAQRDAALQQLQSAVASLQGKVSTLQTTVAAQDCALALLRAKLKYQSVEGQQVIFSGCNVHIVNGLGATDGNPGGTGATMVNGLGNLVLGYNARRHDHTDDRSGSHNLVLGDAQTYTSYAGILAGYHATVTAPYASVTGGYNNKANAPFASVTGGQDNIAHNYAASVTGGFSNSASAAYGSVTGGLQNRADGYAASVLGGYGNTASGLYCAVTGGQLNNASGDFAAVTGGQFNNASGDTASVTGGLSGAAVGALSSVSGGSGVVEQDQHGWAGGSFHSP